MADPTPINETPEYKELRARLSPKRIVRTRPAILHGGNVPVDPDIAAPVTAPAAAPAAAPKPAPVADNGGSSKATTKAKEEKPPAS